MITWKSSLGRALCAGAAALAIGAISALWPVASLAQGAPVSVGIIGNTVEYYPIFIAEKKGFFEKNGIKIDVVSTGGSARSAQMTATKAINIGSSSWLDAMRAIDGRAEIKVVANSLRTATTMLIGGKNVKSIGDLKGKRVSMGGAKDITMVWWTAMARKSGLDPDKDAEVIFSGGTPARFAALAAGGVEAAAVATPLAFKALQDGYSDLGLMASYMPDLPYMAWQADAAWAAANRDLLVRFIRANNQAIAYIYDNANRNEAAQILSTSSGAPFEEALKTHDLVVRIKGFAPDSAGSADGVQGILKLLADFGDVKTPRPGPFYYDDSYVRAASGR
jgi:ABC-type nitrate/sulfonate/bicarbonate transport system substrate-binding protein